MQNGDLSNLRRATAGFAAGITEALVVVTPFEVVKIKLQQQKGTSKELLRYRVRPSSINAHITEDAVVVTPLQGISCSVVAGALAAQRRQQRATARQWETIQQFCRCMEHSLSQKLLRS